MRALRITGLITVATATVALLLGGHSASAASAVSDPESLMPRQYVVEQLIEGDLDKDGDLDVVMVGVDGPAELEELTPDDGDGNRVLVVAQKGPSGYTAVGVGYDALMCRACGGAFWGVSPAPIELKISKGVLIVDQSAGSREVQNWTHRYRIEKNKVRLIGLDSNVYDRANGDGSTSSTNYVTGTTITTITKAEVTSKPKTKKGTPKTILLEKATL